MAEERALVFDTGIDRSGLENGLAEIEEAIASTATVSEKKAEAAFENMEKQAKRLAKAYEDAGMDASEAYPENCKVHSLLLDWHMEQRKSRKSARITNRL